jgi:hypothetical protein
MTENAQVQETKTNNSNDQNEEEGNYLKINTKSQFDIYNGEESRKKLNEIIQYVEELLNEEQSSTFNVWQKILDKLFPKCRREGFWISKLIAKLFQKKLVKKLIESKLNYYLQKRTEITYNKKLVLNKENIENIGYILCYSYSKFDSFRIFAEKTLKNNLSMGKKRNVVTDFYAYCNKKKKSPLDVKMFDYFENNSSIYLAPGILIFLMNCFESLKVIEIELDLDMSGIDSSDDFYLFIITLLNMHHLVSEVDHIKVNFINPHLQKDIFKFFTSELNSIYDNNNRYLKKNKKTYGKNAYKKRWDFETDYILNKQINSSKKEDDNNASIVTNNNDNNIIMHESKNLKLEELSFVDIDKDSEIGDSQFYELRERTDIVKAQKSPRYNKYAYRDRIFHL